MHAELMWQSTPNIVVTLLLAVVATWLAELLFKKLSEKPHFGLSVGVGLVVLVVAATVIQNQKPESGGGTTSERTSVPHQPATSESGPPQTSSSPAAASSRKLPLIPSSPPINEADQSAETLAGPDVLSPGTYRVGETALYTRGGNYSVYVEKFSVTSSFLSVVVDARGREDLIDAQKSCLVSSDGEALPVFDWRPAVSVRGHYAGILRFVNQELRVPVSFLYGCNSGYQPVKLSPSG